MSTDIIISEFSQETERKYKLITRNLQEVLGETELKKIIEVRNPIIYWGTAPTKMIHLGYIFQALKIKDLVDAECEVVILIADLHAVLDNLKSTLETVSFRSIYYEKIMKAVLSRLNVNMEKIKFVKGSDFQKLPEYTMDVYKLASIVSVNQCQHAGAEVVKQSKSPPVTGLLYPILQALDMKYLNADGFIGGVDQRKLNTFALEYLPKLGYKKSCSYLMTPMISGLSTKKSSDPASVSTIENDIVTKMSASIASSKIDLLESPAGISKIISKAYCLDGDADDNSVLKLIKNLIFKITNNFSTIKWDNNTNSIVQGKTYTNYEDLHADIALGSTNGGMHPADLKQSLVNFLIEFLNPIREEFDNEENKKLLADAYGNENGNV